MTSIETLPAGVLSRLIRAVGAEHVITERARLLAYASDALTTISGRPTAVILPRNREELIEVVGLLHEADIDVVPRGAGTGLAGGAVARDAVIVGTARMNRVLAIDPVARKVTAEPGVLTAALSEAAAPYGLRYLPDPASAAACTIGGNVAMNSGGPHCLKHGVTTDHVAGLEVVLPDGQAVRLSRGEDGGIDTASLFIGSEGTLGFVSEVTVSLAPLPPAVQAALALFDSVREAAVAVGDIFAAGIVPVALELIDQATIEVVEASVFAAGLPTDVAAALIIECEGLPEEVRTDLEAVARVAVEAGAREVRVAGDEAERLAIWQARKKAFGALGRLAPDVLVQDAVIPRTALPVLLPQIITVAAEHDLKIANFFHAGDGNLHPNLLFDHRDPEQVRRVEAASSRIMRLCVEAGGTLTGEHGIGLDKVRYLPLIFEPSELETQLSLRAAFDPSSRLNRGKGVVA